MKLLEMFRTIKNYCKYLLYKLKTKYYSINNHYEKESFYSIKLRGIFEDIEVPFVHEEDCLGNWILNGMNVKKLEYKIPYKETYSVPFFSNNKKFGFAFILSEDQIIKLRSNGFEVWKILGMQSWNEADNVKKLMDDIAIENHLIP
jgi:hypothetical protein